MDIDLCKYVEANGEWCDRTRALPLHTHSPPPTTDTRLRPLTGDATSSGTHTHTHSHTLSHTHTHETHTNEDDVLSVRRPAQFQILRSVKRRVTEHGETQLYTHDILIIFTPMHAHIHPLTRTIRAHIRTYTYMNTQAHRHTRVQITRTHTIYIHTCHKITFGMEYERTWYHLCAMDTHHTWLSS